MTDWQKRGPIVQTRRRKKLSPYIVERILDRSVAGPNNCIIWTGARFQDGYGKLRAGGLGMMRAHRVILEAFIGRNLSDTDLACHRCDTPSCVNPNHLFVGTLADNNRDCREKGRNARGVKNAHAKLNPKKIRLMREMRENGSTVSQCAKAVGVSQSTASMALAGKTWRHIKDQDHGRA